MTIILLGAPGSGKGTHGKKVAEHLKVPVISTGDILRVAIRDETALGLRAKIYVDAGQLVPDELVIGMMKERLKEADCAGGYILDGFPRTIPQAEAMEEAGFSLDAVLALQVDDAVIEARMTGRRVCPSCSATFHTESNKPAVEGICNECQTPLIRRSDDEPETVRARLRTYHEQSEPLEAFYNKRGKLKVATGAESLPKTTAHVFEALGL